MKINSNFFQGITLRLFSSILGYTTDMFEMDFRRRKPHFQLIWILEPLLCALRHYNANSNERTRDCVWRSTRRYHRRRLEPDIDRFVVVPLDRIDCAVMGCFITIMVAHFPDERPEFACGYTNADVQKLWISIPLVMLHLKNSYRCYQTLYTSHSSIQAEIPAADVGLVGCRFACCLNKHESILSADFWNSKTRKNFVKSGKTTRIF